MIKNEELTSLDWTYQAYSKEKPHTEVVTVYPEAGAILSFNLTHRYYNRQFITCKPSGSGLLDKVKTILESYYLNRGLPTAQHIAEALHLSSKYLSDCLKQLTGSTTQQLIHGKLIGRVKERLSTTQLSVSEIAYELGFEYPQSFSKLFKTKTQQTPRQFRAGYN